MGSQQVLSSQQEGTGGYVTWGGGATSRGGVLCHTGGVLRHTGRGATSQCEGMLRHLGGGAMSLRGGGATSRREGVLRHVGGGLRHLGDYVTWEGVLHYKGRGYYITWERVLCHLGRGCYVTWIRFTEQYYELNEAKYSSPSCQYNYFKSGLYNYEKYHNCLTDLRTTVFNIQSY